MPTNIQLIIADDHDVYRDGLKSLLQKCPGFFVAADVSNGKELISQCRIQPPDVVLTDIMMPVMDGIEATTIITKEIPSVRVIALSMFNQDDLIIDMLKAGATGYLVKNAQKAEIIEAIQTVYRNIPYYCRSTSRRLSKLIGNNGTSLKSPEREQFSLKELEIIKFICQEKTSREMARELHLSERTIEEYRLRIKEKMQVKGTIGMVMYAIQNNLYKIPVNNS